MHLEFVAEQNMDLAGMDLLVQTLRQELEDANSQVFSDAEELARLAAELEAAQHENACLAEDMQKQALAEALPLKVGLLPIHAATLPCIKCAPICQNQTLAAPASVLTFRPSHQDACADDLCGTQRCLNHSTMAF